MHANPSARASDLKVAAWAASVAVGMLAMAYAAVPLYQMFCQVTGFAGTTQRAEAAPDKVLARTITVRFDSNVAKRAELEVQAGRNHGRRQDR